MWQKGFDVKNLKLPAKILIAAAVLSIAWLVVHYGHIGPNSLDINAVKERFLSKPYHGILLFIPLTLLMNAFGTPRLWICVVAGSLYGIVGGFFLALVITLAGACVNYWAGRAFGQLNVMPIPERFRGWFEKLQNEGFWVLLYARLFPLSNATVVNVLSGIAVIRFRDFFAATLIGFIPTTIVFTMMGCSVQKNSKIQYAITLILFVVFVVWRRWMKSRYVDSVAMDLGEVLPAESA